jgi:pimeloyl-ACP methyl ester carboxylesterase
MSAVRFNEYGAVREVDDPAPGDGMTTLAVGGNGGMRANNPAPPTAPGPAVDPATVSGPLAIAVDEGSGPLVVLLHGFPELPSSWRHQVDPLVEAGYRVVVPYLRGYGLSPAPPDPASYTRDLLAGDIVGVIDASGEEEAVVVGHDQGADVAWTTALLFPERLRAVVGVSVAFEPRTSRPPLELQRAQAGDRFFYTLYFQTPRVAEAELKGNERRFLVSMYAATSGTPTPGAFPPLPAATGRVLDLLPEPDAVPAFLEPDELEKSVAMFARTGFTGGLNIYRAVDLNWHKLPDINERTIQMPAAFTAGELDPALGLLDQAANQQTFMEPPWITDLRLREIIPGAGHWVQQEQPEAFNAALLGFLAGLD